MSTAHLQGSRAGGALHWQTPSAPFFRSAFLNQELLQRARGDILQFAALCISTELDCDADTGVKANRLQTPRGKQTLGAAGAPEQAGPLQAAKPLGT